jgi:hypothetical protein
MSIRRTLGRDGKVYYFGSNGKRLPERTGSRTYVRENFTNIQPSQLSNRELRSYNASLRTRNQFRFEGRFVPNPFGIFNRLEQTNIIPQGERNLTNYFSAQDLLQLLDNTYTQDFSTFRNQARGIFESYETRSGSLLDIGERLSTYLRSGYKIEVTYNGVVSTGRRGLEAIRTFEQNQQEKFLEQRGDALDSVEFNHRVNINPQNRTIKINLNETEDREDGIIPRGGTP